MIRVVAYPSLRARRFIQGTAHVRSENIAEYWRRRRV
jgi:hypothetical protein